LSLSPLQCKLTMMNIQCRIRKSREKNGIERTIDSVLQDMLLHFINLLIIHNDDTPHKSHTECIESINKNIGMSIYSMFANQLKSCTIGTTSVVSSITSSSSSSLIDSSIPVMRKLGAMWCKICTYLDISSVVTIVGALNHEFRNIIYLSDSYLCFNVTSKHVYNRIIYHVPIQTFHKIRHLDTVIDRTTGTEEKIYDDSRDTYRIVRSLFDVRIPEVVPKITSLCTSWSLLDEVFQDSPFKLEELKILHLYLDHHYEIPRNTYFHYPLTIFKVSIFPTSRTKLSYNRKSRIRLPYTLEILELPHYQDVFVVQALNIIWNLTNCCSTIRRISGATLTNLSSENPLIKVQFLSLTLERDSYTSTKLVNFLTLFHQSSKTMKNIEVIFTKGFESLEIGQICAKLMKWFPLASIITNIEFNENEMTALNTILEPMSTIGDGDDDDNDDNDDYMMTFHID
jgi:hypothetical protein